MHTIRILLVDDHAALRAGLRLLLETQDDMKVIGEASDGSEALGLCEALKPDLVILDLSMPGLGGLDALPLFRKHAISTRVLILTMHDDESYVKSALRCGVAGYVLKKAADSELLSAIRTVMRGEIYIHPSLTRALVGDFMPPEELTTDPWKSLTEREQEVLIGVARGLTAAEIADRLSLSPKTVETYRARGMEKLSLRSRAALVQFTLAHRLLT
jgi:DNA-binding NarL/FixJ family response regulator